MSPALFTLVGLGCAHHLPASPPMDAPPPEVETLWQAVVEEGSTDAIVVLHHGEVLLAWPPVDEQVPIETMSVTKSIVSRGIGRLFTRGLLDDVDAPMSTWIPTWGQDERREITLRQVLEHRSGLQNDDTTVSIYKSHDAFGHAVDSPLEAAPGTTFEYNNNATNALAAVFQQAAGTRMDEYIATELFTALGIDDWWWYVDRGGQPHGMSGLRLRAVDLARLGQLVLDEGRVGDTALLSPDWLRSSTVASEDSPWTGWLWWPVWGEVHYAATPALLALWADEGADAARLDGLEHERFESAAAFRQALKARVGDDAVARLGFAIGPHVHPIQRRRQVGAEAQGYLGQYLFVLPEAELVVVRQTRGRAGRDTDFASLRDLVVDLGEALQGD
ncbi:MAG: beta-lactamase family protein [Alphaproteobacteria bacterium]|nr:beta-lactamase family protein [Alphaproteobacteria bacterium]